MKEFIISNLLTVNTVSFTEIVFKLLITLIIGIILYFTYYYSSSKVTYSSSFNYSLVAMAIITTAIMTVISSNIALSLGMVGALSIIRFRTAIKDPRDAMFIFWSIAIGICCGVSQYLIAIVTTAILFIFFMLAKITKEEQRYILIVRCSMQKSNQVKALTHKYFINSRISVQNTNEYGVEIIYELKHYDPIKSDEYLQSLYNIGEIECANFVLQEDTLNA